METKFTRTNKTIKNIETLEENVFASVNKAKKESRKLQIANGGLGKGSLVVLAG